MDNSHRRLKKNLVQLLSWLLVAGIFLYLLAKIVPTEHAQNLSFTERVRFAIHMLGATIAGANIPAVFGLIVGYVVFMMVLDSVATQWIFQRFNCPITFREILPARAVTFLLAVFNYQVGQVALPLYLKRVHRVPLLEGMGSVFFLAAVDLFIVFTMGTAGAFFLRNTEAALAQQILFFGTLGIVGFILNAFFWRFEKISIPLINLLHKLPLLNRVDPKQNIFNAFQKARFRDYITLMLIRLPIHSAILLCMYFLIRFFHADVPFGKILIYLPVVMIVSTFPVINVGALGASQASVVYFFKAFAPEATLLAVSLVWALSVNLLKVLIGAVFLSNHSTKLFRPALPDQIE